MRVQKSGRAQVNVGGPDAPPAELRWKTGMGLYRRQNQRFGQRQRCLSHRNRPELRTYEIASLPGRAPRGFSPFASFTSTHGDAQFFQAGLERGTLHSQYGRGARGAGYPSAGLVQHLLYVSALNLIEVGFA